MSVATIIDTVPSLFQAPTRPYSPGERNSARKPQLFITVIFSSTRATLAALKQAGRLAHHLGAQIRVLMPQIVPYPLDLHQPPIKPAHHACRFLTVTPEETIRTEIEVLLCREPSNAILQVLAPHSLVLIGGCKSWWPTRETRLSRKLLRAGHEVIFVSET